MLEHVFPLLVILGLIITPFVVPLAIFLKIIKKRQRSTYKKPQTKLEDILALIG